MNANSFLQLSIVLTWGCNLLLALTALRINRMKRQREQLAPGIRGGIERDAINGRINRAYRHVQILLGGIVILTISMAVGMFALLKG